MSSSRYLTVTENITVTMDFEVPPFKDKAAGECVSSRFFKVGGYDWIVDFYPNGEEGVFSSSYVRGFASVFLRCLGRGDNVKVKFTLGLLSPMADTAEHTLSTPRKVLHCITRGDARMSTFETDAKLLLSACREGPVFSPGRYEWGYRSFLRKQQLERLSSFKIRCVLNVLDEDPPPLELPYHLEHALKDGGGTDVTFDVDGVLFRAHSVVVAERSPVFNAQLFGPMKEKDMSHVEVVDMEPDIFEMLLHFIYTDSLPPTCDVADDDDDDSAFVMQHLLVAADRYGMDRLKLLCERKLCNMVSMKTVDSSLALADQHSCMRLRVKCIDILDSVGVHAGTVCMADRIEYCLDGGYWPGLEQQVMLLSETLYSRAFIVTENITTTLNFELGNYQMLNDVAITYVSSRIFRVGGYDWRIVVYPQGKGTGAGDHASAYLHCSGPQYREPVRVKFALSMVQEELQIQIASFAATEREFSQGSYDYWGYPEFVNKSGLKWLSTIFGNVSFTIKCVLTVVNKEPPPLELPDHLARALNSGRGADVTFVVNGMELSAHRFVLVARSPVFALELFDSPATERVEVADMEPTIFKMMLHFVYTDTIPPCNDGEAGHGDVVVINDRPIKR